MSWLVVAAIPLMDAVLDAGSPPDVERLVGPRLDPRARPRGAIARRDVVRQGSRHRSPVRAELGGEDAAIPYGVETDGAEAGLACPADGDASSTPVVLE